MYLAEELQEHEPGDDNLDHAHHIVLDAVHAEIWPVPLEEGNEDVELSFKWAWTALLKLKEWIKATSWKRGVDCVIWNPSGGPDGKGREIGGMIVRLIMNDKSTGLEH